jgi:hypothetical protein
MCSFRSSTELRFMSSALRRSASLSFGLRRTSQSQQLVFGPSERLEIWVDFSEPSVGSELALLITSRSRPRCVRVVFRVCRGPIQ